MVVICLINFFSLKDDVSLCQINKVTFFMQDDER